MADEIKKVLVLNLLTGELQQQQDDQTVFGLHSNDVAATVVYTDGKVADEKTRAEAAEATLSAAVINEQAARIADDALKVNKAGDKLTGTLTFTNGATITGVVNPVAATDVANKQYVDALAAGLSWQEPVESIGEGLPAVDPVAGHRYLNITDKKIYTSAVS